MYHTWLRSLVSSLTLSLASARASACALALARRLFASPRSSLRGLSRPALRAATRTPRDDCDCARAAAEELCECEAHLGPVASCPPRPRI
eukprot:scaffold32567_cov123-Isochrysis_galbana.AAC.1